MLVLGKIAVGKKHLSVKDKDIFSDPSAPFKPLPNMYKSRKIQRFSSYTTKPIDCGYYGPSANNEIELSDDCEKNTKNNPNYKMVEPSSNINHSSESNQTVLLSQKNVPIASTSTKETSSVHVHPNEIIIQDQPNIIRPSLSPATPRNHYSWIMTHPSTVVGSK